MKTQACALIAMSLLFQGCQQGSKKDPQSAAVYHIQTEDIEQTEQNLAKKNVFLSPASIGNKNANAPSEIFDASKASNEVQILLSDYINKTQKLMSLADEKLVLFPKKAEIKDKENRAATLLGQILATQESNDIRELTQSATADHAEFEIRFKRISICLKNLREVGLDFSNIDNFPHAIKTKSTKELTSTQKGVDVCMDDTFRVKTLLQRNNDFNIEGLKKYEDNLLSFGGVFYSANETINTELTRRRKRKN